MAKPEPRIAEAPAKQVSPPPPPRLPLNMDKKLAEIIPGQVEKSKISIHIIKSAFRLTLVYDGQEVKDYRVVFGGDPVNDKRRKGDKRTPEGLFSIRSQYPHPSWSRFMWLTYPTAESWQKHNAAKANSEISASAGIGGEIGIHGVPTGQDAWVDGGVNWTAGCISLKTADIKELYEVTQAGTSVVIDH